MSLNNELQKSLNLVFRGYRSPHHKYIVDSQSGHQKPRKQITFDQKVYINSTLRIFHKVG